MAFSNLWSQRGYEEQKLFLTYKYFIEKVHLTFRIVGHYLTGKKQTQIPNISYMDYSTLSPPHF